MENKEEVVKLLLAEIEKIGSMRKLADRWGYSVQYIWDVVNGNRPPSKGILTRLGLKLMAVPEHAPDDAPE